MRNQILRATQAARNVRGINLLIAAAAVVLAGAAACFSDDGDDGMGPEGEVAAVVDMTGDLTFDQRTVTIQVGETVRWENVSDNDSHTVTADPSEANSSDTPVGVPEGAATFGSPLISPGGDFEYTFTVAGRYDYFCRPHEAAGMFGTVIVE